MLNLLGRPPQLMAPHRRRELQRTSFLPRPLRWVRWLAPGLSLKRWLFASVLGVLLSSLGLAIWFKLTPVYRLLELIETVLTAIATVVPSYISGPLALILGVFLVFWGQSRTVNSITEVLTPEGDDGLLETIATYRLLNKGPKIVAIGGGTGLSTLLRGLKAYSANITAIVTVADDGGSSGRLRRDTGMLPPGDIRNCLAALADREKLLTELFQYRFRTGEGLSGHSFGNLFLSALNDITGDFEAAIAASSKVLAIRGRVLPATNADVHLWAELEDGRRIEGESNIPAAGGKIRSLGCTPEAPPAVPAAIAAIESADLIVLGPGSLYTSIIPNLLVPKIAEAIARARCPRIYLCNVMTQPGETDGYTVADHIRAIDRSCGGQSLFDAVLVQGKPPSEESLKRYATERAHPVFCDREDIAGLGRRIVQANVMREDPQTYRVRHDPEKVARVLLRWYGRARGIKLAPE